MESKKSEDELEGKKDKNKSPIAKKTEEGSERKKYKNKSPIAKKTVTKTPSSKKIPIKLPSSPIRSKRRKKSSSAKAAIKQPSPIVSKRLIKTSSKETAVKGPRSPIARFVEGFKDWMHKDKTPTSSSKKVKLKAAKPNKSKKSKKMKNLKKEIKQIPRKPVIIKKIETPEISDKDGNKKMKLKRKKQVGVTIAKLPKPKVQSRSRKEKHGKKQKKLTGKIKEHESDESDKEIETVKDVNKMQKKMVKQTDKLVKIIPRTKSPALSPSHKPKVVIKSAKFSPPKMIKEEKLIIPIQSNKPSSPTAKSEPVITVNKITVSYPGAKKSCVSPKKSVEKVPCKKEPCKKQPSKKSVRKVLEGKQPTLIKPPVYLMSENTYPEKVIVSLLPLVGEEVPQTPCKEEEYEYDEKYPTWRPQQFLEPDEKTAQSTEHTYGNVEKVKTDLGYLKDDFPTDDEEMIELDKITSQLLAIVGPDPNESYISMQSAKKIIPEENSSATTFTSAQKIIEDKNPIESTKTSPEIKAKFPSESTKTGIKNDIRNPRSPSKTNIEKNNKR